MAEMPGIARPERQALPQLRDREGSRVRTACLYGLAFAFLKAFLLGLFPAHAGVILTAPPAQARSSTFPRPRGGDP